MSDTQREHPRLLQITHDQAAAPKAGLSFCPQGQLGYRKVHSLSAGPREGWAASWLGTPLLPLPLGGKASKPPRHHRRPVSGQAGRLPHATVRLRP